MFALFYFEGNQHKKVKFRLNFQSAIGLLMLLLALSFSTMGQKRKPIKKGKTGKSNSTANNKTPFGKQDIFFWAELSAGYGPQRNKGSYLDFQKLYYQTLNPAFSISGNLQDQDSPLISGSFHVGKPLRNPIIKFVSGGISLSWAKRNLFHNLNFTNTSLGYRNQIQITDNLISQFLGAEGQLRFGGKVYGLLGIRTDLILTGIRERKLTVESDSIILPSGMEKSWDLRSSDLVRSSGLGWHAGIGYNPLPFLGFRAGYWFNGSFFKSGPDFATSQIYVAICLGLIR